MNDRDFSPLVMPTHQSDDDRVKHSGIVSLHLARCSDDYDRIGKLSGRRRHIKPLIDE